MKRLRLAISGKVQGVFYREHVRKVAQSLGLNGYVKNLPDNTVEIVAEGDDSKLNKLITECRRGSFMSRVDNLESNEEKPTGEFEGFLIEF